MEKEVHEAPPSKTGTHVSFDYFRATTEIEILESAEEEILVREYVIKLAEKLNITRVEIIERQFKKDKYKYMFELGPEMELGMIGPKSASGLPTCSLHLKGKGCREYETRNPDKGWGYFLKLMLVEYNAKPTRIDIAVDDFDGDVVTLPWVEEKLKKKYFTSCFKHKYHKIHGCEEEGYSLEMGSRNSSCQLVIYDKLKEQIVKKKKEVNQDYWIRYEMRFFHEKAHKLALEMLLAIEGKLSFIIEKDADKAFLEYVNSVFIGVLDIKEDNNYDIMHQCDVATDPLWMEFVHNAEKWKVIPETNKTSSWITKQTSVKRMMPSYFLTQYLLAGKNFYHFNTLILRDFKEHFKKLYTKSQLKTLNIYSMENGMEPINDDKLHQIEDELDNELKERLLPF